MDRSIDHAVQHKKNTVAKSVFYPSYSFGVFPFVLFILNLPIVAGGPVPDNSSSYHDSDIHSSGEPPQSVACVIVLKM